MGQPFDRARWERVSAILDAVMELAPEARKRSLDEACGANADLRREVEELLAAAAAPAGFLGVSAVEQAASLVASLADQPAHSLPGRAVGAYRLLRELGEGGMGVVYLAERADGQFEQKVAIKLLKQGLHGAESRRRFLTERQILARLQHPAIARLLDGGVTTDGMPYFVMECVEGEPISKYCQDCKLGIDRRLRIFLEVCEAVQYAHRNLIVHRDLKPSNILVDAADRVKLLDFGIAKLMGDDRVAVEHTRSFARIMTPEYAAPEQVRGEPVSTSTDVYALGVVLYELLTGQRPYRVPTGGFGEIERAILDQDPAAPSDQLARAGGSPEMRRRLRGDLDRIALKTLQKEPDRRYPSAEALAADIRRHLEGLPVVAHGDALVYRARKFLRRHRIAVSAAGLLLLAVIGGLVGTTWQARRAEAARRDADLHRVRAERRVADLRQLVNAFLFDVHDALADLPGGATTRRLVASKAREYLDGLAAEAGQDAGLQDELATAYERVSDASLRAGEFQEALDGYTRAAAIRRALAGARPADRARGLALGVSLMRVGDAHRAARRVDEAIAAYREAASVDEGLVAADPRDGSARRRLLETSERLCDQLAERGSTPTALASCGQRLTLIDNLLRDEPRDVTLRNKRIAAAGRLASVLRAAGQLDEARRVESEAERSVREVGRTYPLADPLVGVWRRRPKTLDNPTGNMSSHAVRIARVEPRLNGLSFTYFDDRGETVVSFVIRADGKPAAMFGPGGQRIGTVHTRRIDPRHGESWGEGLPYIYERSSISPDGRTWISEARMKAPNGQEFVDVDTWDKEQDIVYSASSKRPPERRQ